ncbi:MAG: hypothetical protein C9356_15165 [Oleiphilus sp.]|nr:MAG: hypothetical protein C9356_15165 [Oleiphilus sp.]
MSDVQQLSLEEMKSICADSRFQGGLFGQQYIRLLCCLSVGISCLLVARATGGNSVVWTLLGLFGAYVGTGAYIARTRARYISEKLGADVLPSFIALFRELRDDVEGHRLIDLWVEKFEKEGFLSSGETFMLVDKTMAASGAASQEEPETLQQAFSEGGDHAIQSKL